MFVRNNIACPNCGKSRTFDVYPDPISEGYDSRRMALRAECFHCLAFSRTLIRKDVLAFVVLEATESLPYSDPLSRGKRWKTPIAFERRQLRAIHSLVLDVFMPGEVRWELADHKGVSQLSAAILCASGDPIDFLLCREWFDFAFKWCDIDTAYLSTLGQPLAS